MLPDPIAHLKTLHLDGMAQRLTELVAEQHRHPPTPVYWLPRRLEADQVDRHTISL